MKKVKSILTKTIMLITVATILLSISCDSIDLSPVDCSECYTDEPEYGEIELKLTINDENPEIKITLYKEKFDATNPIYSEIVETTSIQLVIRTNIEYVVKAEYLKNGRSYHVVNRAKLKTKLDKENCDEHCYYIVGKSVDLRIKD